MSRSFYFLTLLTICISLAMAVHTTAQESGEVIITEIMYDPQSTGSQSSVAVPRRILKGHGAAVI